MKYTAVFVLSLCLCAPALAAPPSAAVPPTASAAERTYAAKVEGNARRIDSDLGDLYSLFRFPQLQVPAWKRKAEATLAQVGAAAQGGRKLHAPPRLHPVQEMYSIAMADYAESARGMNAAIEARDIKSITRYTDEMREASAVMQRAVTLLHTLERQQPGSADGSANP